MASEQLIGVGDRRQQRCYTIWSCKRGTRGGGDFSPGGVVLSAAASRAANQSGAAKGSSPGRRARRLGYRCTVPGQHMILGYFDLPRMFSRCSRAMHLSPGVSCAVPGQLWPITLPNLNEPSLAQFCLLWFGQVWPDTNIVPATPGRCARCKWYRCAVPGQHRPTAFTSLKLA